MPISSVFKHLAVLVAIGSLWACPQMGPGGMSATGSPRDASSESSSKSDKADPSLAPGPDGALNPYGADGAGGTPGGGGSAGGAGDSSDSSTTVAARRVDPLSATADPSSVECPPNEPPENCIRRKAMMHRMETAISNDPRIDLKAGAGSQFVRIVNLPEETATRLGLTSDEMVLESLRAGTLAQEAVQAAVVQDVAVAVRPDGSFDLAPFLKTGLNLVFADTSGSTAAPPADLASTMKSERFSYLGHSSLSAAEFKAIRLDELKKANLNEAR
ncbi:MAG TPA: hypothetical protein VLJ37_05720, partial [bacterium]|nr:hypothetical protein [bacterium]